MVNIISDGHDSDLTDGICYYGVSGCTLRAAIEQASHDGVPTTITFSPTIAGQTILLAGTYGTINWTGNSITVDGGSNLITISGQNLNANQSVIQISGNHNSLVFLSIRDSQWDGVQVGDFGGVGAGNYNNLNYLSIYHSVAGGVYIHGSPSGGNYNSVDYSIIGATNSSDAYCSSATGNGFDGIYIDGGADNTYIYRNRIVCSLNNGIYINGSGGASSNTQIDNNSIGTDGDSSSFGNGWNGVHDEGNSGTQITDNVISGNGQYGVWLHGSTNAMLISNKIGTNNAGNAALPNQLEGVAITDNASSNIIGDPSNASLSNIISGNNRNGVVFTSGANNNELDGNYIGLGADGVSVIPNAWAGVAFFNAPDNFIGGQYSTSRVNQYISGNSREGVYITNSDNIRISSYTYIGVDTSNDAAGNGLEGIKLDSGTTNAVIGPGEVMYNGLTGIAVLWRYFGRELPRPYDDRIQWWFADRSGE